jgi:hypothetical protein
MTNTPALKSKKPMFSLGAMKPWHFGLFVGCPIGNLFYFAVVVFSPFSHFSLWTWLSVNVATFLLPFLGVTGIHQFIDSGIFDIFGLRRRMDPRDIERIELLGRIEQLGGAGDWRQANRLRVDLLTRGLAPNPAVVAFEIGRVFEEKLGSPVEALAWYRRCAGYGEENNSHFQEARHRAELLKDAVRADDADRQAREAAVNEAIRIEDYERAQTATEELARLHPNSPAVHFFRGMIASRRGAHALAAGHYRDALRANPDDEKAAYSLAAAHTQAGELHAARQAWREYLDKFPNADPKFVQSARDSLAEIDAQLQNDLAAYETNK